MNSSAIEKFAPLILLIAIIALWQAVCSLFNVHTYHTTAPP